MQHQKDNTQSILEKGLLKGFDGVVYLTKKPDESVRFLAFRFVNEITVFEVNIPKQYKDKVMESFDHNEKVFGCKAYMYLDDIPKEWVTPHSEYQRKE